MSSTLVVVLCEAHDILCAILKSLGLAPSNNPPLICVIRHSILRSPILEPILVQSSEQNTKFEGAMSS